MNMGIVLSFFNQRYFRDSLSMWCASSGTASLPLSAYCL